MSFRQWKIGPTKLLSMERDFMRQNPLLMINLLLITSYFRSDCLSSPYPALSQTYTRTTTPRPPTPPPHNLFSPIHTLSSLLPTSCIKLVGQNNQAPQNQSHSNKGYLQWNYSLVKRNSRLRPLTCNSF